MSTRAHTAEVKGVPEQAGTDSTPQAQANLEKVRAAAAASSAPTPVTNAYVTANPASELAASKPSGPVNVISQEVTRHAEERRVPKQAKFAPAQSKPKPQLLMAVGLGFVLGRAFGFVNGRGGYESESRGKESGLFR